MYCVYCRNSDNLGFYTQTWLPSVKKNTLPDGHLTFDAESTQATHNDVPAWKIDKPQNTTREYTLNRRRIISTPTALYQLDSPLKPFNQATKTFYLRKRISWRNPISFLLNSRDFHSNEWIPSCHLGRWTNNYFYTKHISWIA